MVVVDIRPNAPVTASAQVTDEYQEDIRWAVRNPEQ